MSIVRNIRRMFSIVLLNLIMFGYSSSFAISSIGAIHNENFEASGLNQDLLIKINSCGPSLSCICPNLIWPYYKVRRHCKSSKGDANWETLCQACVDKGFF